MRTYCAARKAGVDDGVVGGSEVGSDAVAMFLSALVRLSHVCFEGQDVSRSSAQKEGGKKWINLERWHVHHEDAVKVIGYPCTTLINVTLPL